MNLAAALATAVNQKNAATGQGRTDYTAEDMTVEYDTNPIGEYDEYDYEARYGYFPTHKSH